MIAYPNCKINLGLIVTGKREDGFHNIETIFYPVYDLFDILEIIPSKDFEFSSSGMRIDGKVDNNICVRAYNLIKQDFDIPSVKIHLHKQIPIGAGLGGGSSDGSFTIRMLNDIFELKLNTEQLEHYASQLGSDTTFFIQNRAAFAYNRGTDFDHNISIPDLSNYKMVVKDLGIHISTKEAYSGITPNQEQPSPKDIISHPINEWKDLLTNQFEYSIFKSHPEIEAAKQEFYNNGAIYASMSGSGSSVFGIWK